jgi:hypothetical protein
MDRSSTEAGAKLFIVDQIKRGGAAFSNDEHSWLSSPRLIQAMEN